MSVVGGIFNSIYNRMLSSHCDAKQIKLFLQNWISLFFFNYCCHLEVYVAHFMLNRTPIQRDAIWCSFALNGATFQ